MVEGEIEQIKNLLHEIATHAYSLAMGLQHAAPTLGGEASPPKTVQYLLRISTLIQQTENDFATWRASRLSKASSYDLNRPYEEIQKLIELVTSVMQEDEALREEYQTIGKFRFVHDRLTLYLQRLQHSFAAIPVKKERSARTVLPEEQLIYVYLYNAHGLQFSTWQNLMNPRVFYEYSVNRPIYAEQSQIDALLRVKVNPAQHGYLTIAVKKSDILRHAQETHDFLGQPLIKVREGSLLQENVVSFTHNNRVYVLGEHGELSPL